MKEYTTFDEWIDSLKDLDNFLIEYKRCKKNYSEISKEEIETIIDLAFEIKYHAELLTA